MWTCGFQKLLSLFLAWHLVFPWLFWPFDIDQDGSDTEERKLEGNNVDFHVTIPIVIYGRNCLWFCPTRPRVCSWHAILSPENWTPKKMYNNIELRTSFTWIVHWHDPPERLSPFCPRISDACDGVFDGDVSLGTLAILFDCSTQCGHWYWY